VGIMEILFVVGMSFISPLVLLYIMRRRAYYSCTGERLTPAPKDPRKHVRVKCRRCLYRESVFLGLEAHYECSDCHGIALVRDSLLMDS
jgi:hypothetical protein